MEAIGFLIALSYYSLKTRVEGFIKRRFIESMVNPSLFTHRGDIMLRRIECVLEEMREKTKKELLPAYKEFQIKETDSKEVKSPKKQEINNSFNLYPNPNNGGFTLSYSLQKGQIGMFIIYNLLGQDIQEDELNPSLQTMNITANTKSNGIYLYEIIVNGSPVKKDKLIIIK